MLQLHLHSAMDYPWLCWLLLQPWSGQQSQGTQGWDSQCELECDCREKRRPEMLAQHHMSCAAQPVPSLWPGTVCSHQGTLDPTPAWGLEGDRLQSAHVLTMLGTWDLLSCGRNT